MIKFAKYISLIIGLLLVTVSSFSETISLDEYFEIAKQNHPLFKKENLSPQIAVLARDFYLGEKDWILSGSTYYRYIKTVGENPFDPEKIEATALELGAQKSLWSTGGNISIIASSSFTDQEAAETIVPGFESFSFTTPIFYKSGLSITYSHPLLRNSRGKLSRFSYEQANFSITRVILQSLENKELFLLDLGIKFLDWVLLSEQLNIANERLILAEQQYDQTKRKKESNLVDQVDVLRSEDSVRIAKQNAMLIESQWQAKQAELATLIQSKELYLKNPDYNLAQLNSVLSINRLTDHIQNNSRTIQGLNVTKDRLVHQLDALQNKKKPRLNLDLTTGLYGGEDDFGGSLEIDKPEFIAALKFSHPWENTATNSEIKKVALEIEQINYEINSIELSIEAEAISLITQLNGIKEVLALNLKQIESAKEKTKEEIKLYNMGRSQLTFVIQSQDNEQNSRLTYAQNLVLYHKLLLQYKSLVDELLL